jgi:hypothetical protein
VSHKFTATGELDYLKKNMGKCKGAESLDFIVSSFGF